LGESERALEYLQAALDLWAESEDIRGEATTLHYFGYTYAALGDMKKALEYYNQALPLRPHRRRSTARGIHAGYAGAALSCWRNAEGAGVRPTSPELQRTIKDAGLRQSPSNTSVMFNTCRETFALAIPYYNEALSLAQAVGDRQIEANALQGLARVERDRGDFVTARKHIEDAISKIEGVRGQVDIRCVPHILA